MKTLPLSLLLLACHLASPTRAETPVHCRIALADSEPASEALLTWASEPNHWYKVQSSGQLGQPWQTLNTQPLLGLSNSPVMTLRDPTDRPHRFYRVLDLDLLWIPPGTFTLGSPENEAERFVDEGPQTTVTLSQGFWIGRFELTQNEYLEVTGTNTSSFTGNERFPVESASWMEAVAYGQLRTEQERLAGRLPAGYEYRLPTEAEWEYAGRAGTTSAFHYGSALLSGMANFWGMWEYDAMIGSTENPEGLDLAQPTFVGQYVPNAWGLYDMHGNVNEWCRDRYAPSLPGGQVTDPRGPASGSYRVLRGGSWADDGAGCRSAWRPFAEPTDRNNATGFRVVLGHPLP